MKKLVLRLSKKPIRKNKNNHPLLCFIFFLFTISNTIEAQVVTTFSANGTYTVPAEITAIRVETWGGGGAGGNAATLVGLAAKVGGGGGGGGAYNSIVYLVNPSELYTVTIGQGGVSGGTVNGGVTTVAGIAGTITANGGSAGGNGSAFLVGLDLTVVQGTAGAGGTGGVYAGGAGGASIIANSGAGGGGAGNQSVGGAAGSGTTGGSGGTGTYSGGVGANSFTATSNGANGAAPGGGGSGARVNELASIMSRNGGSGGNGQVRITAYRCYPGYDTTWNGSAWSNGSPNKNKKAIIDGNYSTGTNGNITTCSCQINTTRTLAVGASNQLEVYNEITNNGILDVANNASLVQWYSTNANSGQAKVHRNAHPMKRFDFTYWASPVAGQTLNAFSPNTLSDKYYSYSPSSGWVTHLNGVGTMEVGKGYAIRAPQSFPLESTNTFAGTFTGVPNNGEIIVAGFQGSASGEVWNLIGNPYPSAIDIDLFLADPDNTEVGGTIYLWTHNSPPSNQVGGSAQYNYTANDYTTYNLSGGVAVAAIDDPNDPTEADDNDNVLVNGYVASGQAFFIRGVKQFDDLTPAVSPIVKFKNTMRVAGSNTNFFKPGATTPIENWEMTGKHRFWINLRNDEGAFNQALIGYIENATDGLDRLYDGELFGGNFVTLYSLLDQNKLTIQGKSLPFNENDVVPLGYITTIAGNFTINLDHFDGLFEGQDIFLKDKLLNVLHNLKESDYAFTSAIGTFENRFEIAYTETLGIQNLKGNPNGIIIYQNLNSDIVVNAGLTLIAEIKVYDVAGRLLYEESKINNSETFIRNLPVSQQVLIVEVLTIEGYKMRRKTIH